jgi:CheY-like chemotaxis protein
LHNYKAVLKVDDDLDIISIINSLWEDMASMSLPLQTYFSIRTFQTKFNEYDLVLSDVRMPGMTGFEFIIKEKCSRLLKPYLCLQLKLMTRFSKALSPNTKINGYVQKPVSPKELIR